MYRFSLITLFLFLPLSAPLYAQSVTEQLDSILDTPADTNQVRGLSILAHELNRTLNPIPDVLFERGIKLAHELNDKWGLAELYSRRYIYYMNNSQAEKALGDMEQAITYSGASGMTEALQRARNMKVYAYISLGRKKEAAELASALVKEYHDSGNVKEEAKGYIQLAALSSDFGNRELALAYDSIALALSGESGDEVLLARANSSSSINHNLLGYHEKALKLAEDALALARKNNHIIYANNAYSARAGANLALRNYTKALEDYELLDAKEQGKRSWRMTNKGLALQRLGRHEEARKLLYESANIIINQGAEDPLELIRCYEALQTIGLNQSQYDSVVYFRRLMAAQKDSLQASENIRNLLELKEKYETEEKEAAIRLQQEQLALQRSQLYALVSGLVLALVAGIIFFLLSRRLRKSNAEKEQLLTEKETLIGEIHHRVKNNLQVVSSLLQLQRRGLDANDEKGQEALLESQSRVSAMGLIHNKLYQGQEVTSVHMPDYLKDLGETLIDAYRLDEQVEIYYDVADISLDVDTAIPLGLIINELVTNSLKYAFPKGREGTIEIALNREGDKLRLEVNDDGVGVQAAEKRADSTSFGSNLIELLTQKLKGSLQFTKEQGHGVQILFSE